MGLLSALLLGGVVAARWTSTLAMRQEFSLADAPAEGEDDPFVAGGHWSHSESGSIAPDGHRRLATSPTAATPAYSLYLKNGSCLSGNARETELLPSSAGDCHLFVRHDYDSDHQPVANFESVSIPGQCLDFYNDQYGYWGLYNCSDDRPNQEFEQTPGGVWCTTKFDKNDCVAPVPKLKAPHNHASATDDPHLTSLAGERFNVGAPGTYTLLRAPKDEQRPALLQILADVNEEPGAPCALYMKSIELSGEFFQGGFVQVLPLARDETGSNSAGIATKRPFSLVERFGGNSTSTPWDRARQEWAAGGRVLGPQVGVRATELHEMSGLKEGRAFEFTVGSEARVIIQQASHQALNLKLHVLGSLGVAELGGLLGTGKHSENVERPTERCRESRASKEVLMMGSRRSSGGSSMEAFW